MELPVSVFSLAGLYEFAAFPPVNTQLLGEPFPIISVSVCASAAVLVAGLQLGEVK